MSMRRVGFLLALLLGATAVVAAPARAPRAAQAYAPAMTTDNSASCDIGTMPSATLLLPYFEVEFRKPVTEAGNTIFTVVNTSRTPQVARVTIWTDQGYPAAWFHVFLTGYDVQPISLYDVLSLGRLPQTSSATEPGARSASTNGSFISIETCNAAGGEMPAEALAALQNMLTTGIRDDAKCRVGGQHTMATGYVTVDVVNGCSPLSPLEIGYYSQVLLFDNVLTGDYERINPESKVGNYAGGNPLVHIKAIPEGGTAGSGTSPLPYTFYDRYTPPNARKIDRRQPLPSTFAARYIQGGTAQFQTDYAIWREGVTPGAQMCTNANATMPLGQIVRFDESENATTMLPDLIASTIPSAASLATSSYFFPPVQSGAVSGWMYLNLDNGAGHTGDRASNPYSTRRASQNWVIIHMRAEGRFGVDFDATAIGNGCTPGQASDAIMKRPETPKE